ncbi:MAG: gamma-glutamyl-gamma-aminobutyrate hydrolase family protein [Ignavibacteriales bacterium]|nr:gamma-glutamyl-gamma-aminobutyrate hydrolase family protein [Ignavibacteriales bacterium]
MLSHYRIGLTLRSSNATSYFEERDSISYDWIRFLDKSGLYPILIPNALRDPVLYIKKADIDILVLTNGEDFRRKYYHNPKYFEPKFNPARDKSELLLLEWAIKNDIPTLAVCRGFQFVNIYKGGKLIPFLKENIDGGINHVATNHSIKILDNNLEFLNKSRTSKVNSFHNHGIIKSTLGSDLIPFAIATDGVIEGFYLKNKPLLGIQWHPERKGSNNFIQKQLFKYFIDNGKWW